MKMVIRESLLLVTLAACTVPDLHVEASDGNNNQCCRQRACYFLDDGPCKEAYDCVLEKRVCDPKVTNCGNTCRVSDTLRCSDHLTQSDCYSVANCLWQSSDRPSDGSSCRRDRSCSSLSDSACTASHDCTFAESCSTLNGQYGSAQTSTSTCSKRCVSSGSRECSEFTDAIGCGRASNCVWQAGSPLGSSNSDTGSDTSGAKGSGSDYSFRGFGKFGVAMVALMASF